MTLKPIDINWVRGKRDLVLTMNGESWPIGIADATFENVSGVMRSSAKGQVIENKSFWDGSLEIAHDDVVVRNCYFRNKSFHTVYQLANVQNAVVELCTFDGRPDGAVVNASNSDFVFAHNRPMTMRQCVVLDASNDSLNFVGGLCERNLIIGGGFTAGAHADAISVHTTVAAFTSSKNYIDFTQRPGAVIPNACIKYVSVPSIGQGQNAGNGIAHDVMCYDSVLIGGGYVCYLDTNHSKVERCVVGWGYWYPTDEQGDVYPPVPAGYKNNTNPQDAAEDYVSVAVGESGEVQPPIEPEPPAGGEDLEDVWAAIKDINESLKATNDKVDLLIENLHKV